eukprot:320863-Amphidinium_carterae.2
MKHSLTDGKAHPNFKRTGMQQQYTTRTQDIVDSISDDITSPLLASKLVRSLSSRAHVFRLHDYVHASFKQLFWVLKHSKENPMGPPSSPEDAAIGSIPIATKLLTKN